MKVSLKYWRSSIVLAVVAVVLFGTTTACAAQNPNPGVLPPQSHPNGLTYGEWSNAWWQWALKIPAPVNPVIDTTGANCGVGQSGQVWFLAGVFGTGTATRNDCTVPAGKKLFFPIWNIVSIATDGTPPDCPPNGENADQLRNDIAGSIMAQDPTTYKAQVDGESITNLAIYRAGPNNPSFNLHNLALDTFNTVFRTQCTSLASQYLAVSDGWYLMLAPLTPGKHTIHFEVPNTQNITYNLTVKA